MGDVHIHNVLLWTLLHNPAEKQTQILRNSNPYNDISNENYNDDCVATQLVMCWVLLVARYLADGDQ